MRASYFVLGIVIGALVMNGLTARALVSLDRMWETNLRPYLLAAYSDGWLNGHTYAGSEYSGRLSSCLNELNRFGRGGN